MEQDHDSSGANPIRELLMPDVSGEVKWLGPKDVDLERKTPNQVDVDMLRAERLEILAEIAETDRQGSEFENLMAELQHATHLLLAAEADLIDEQRNR